MDIATLVFQICGLFLAGGAGLTAFIKAVQWYISHRDERADRLQKEAQAREDAEHDATLADAFERVHKVYGTLNRLLSATGAARVLLLRAHNGGSIPRAGVPLYSSVLYEVWDGDVLEPIKSTWQKQRLSETYVSMLLEVATKGEATVITKDLPPCVLKDTYEATGVARAEVHKVRAEAGAFYYLSITFAHDVEPNGNHRHMVRIGLQRLRALLKP